MKNGSPKMKKLLNRRNNALYSPQIYTTKELLDKTSNKTIYKYHSIYNKNSLTKKIPSSPKTKKNNRGLTINPNLRSITKKVKCVTPNPRKSIQLESTKGNFGMKNGNGRLRSEKFNRKRKKSQHRKQKIFPKQSLSCKNKQVSRKGVDMFFKSGKNVKGITPNNKKRQKSKNGYELGGSKMQNFFASKRKDNPNKEKENKEGYVEARIKPKKAIDLVNVLNVHFLGKLDVDFFLSHFAKILALFYYFDNKDDCYLVIKQYTEEVQQDAFLALEKLFGGKKKGGVVLTAFKLEVVSVMLLFYFFVEKATISRKEINGVLEPLARNSSAFLSLLRKALSFILKKKKARKIKTFLKDSETDKLFSFSKNPVKAIKKNNEAIRLSLNKIIKLVAKELQGPLRSLITTISEQSLSDAVYNAFEFFHSALKQKGVIVAMETQEDQLIGEENPNFIIQPFEAKYLLPPKTSPHNYTLVLDLDETLIHYDENTNGGQFFIRPHSQEFLKETAKHYELVIFTAAVKDYADWILDRLDPDGYIAHRLYRCSTSQQNGVYIKDLQKLGRDMDKMLIIDNSPENFQLQPENGIYIRSWYNDPDDTALVELLGVLEKSATTPDRDIRQTLKSIRETHAN